MMRTLYRVKHSYSLCNNAYIRYIDTPTTRCRIRVSSREIKWLTEKPPDTKDYLNLHNSHYASISTTKYSTNQIYNYDKELSPLPFGGGYYNIVN